MDMRSNRMAQNNTAEAFQTFNFPQKDTNGLLQGLSQLLGILERVLVISPQELAQTASHELTAEEVKNMNQAKSTRYEYTAGAVDRGVYALKTLLYNGMMAYADPEVFARLPLPINEAALEKLGFELEDEADGTHAIVKGKKSALWVESFSSTRDGDLRANSSAAASQMVQMLQTITGNQMLFQAVGVDQIISLVNEITQIAGLPRDFRFAVSPQFNEAQQQQMIQQQLQQIAQQIQQGAVQASVQEVAKQLTPVFKTQQDKFNEVENQTVKLTQQTGQLSQQLEQVTEVLKSLIAPPPPPPPPVAPPIPSPYDNVPPAGPIPPDPGAIAAPPGMGYNPGMPPA